MSLLSTSLHFAQQDKLAVVTPYLAYPITVNKIVTWIFLEKIISESSCVFKLNWPFYCIVDTTC